MKLAKGTRPANIEQPARITKGIFIDHVPFTVMIIAFWFFIANYMLCSTFG